MIPVATEHYAAIGKIAVQSGILERELHEYITNLAQQTKSQYGLRPQLKRLRKGLATATVSQAAPRELEQLLDKIDALVLQRNTVVHGVWQTR